jgi:hypothetical protein
VKGLEDRHSMWHHSHILYISQRNHITPKISSKFGIHSRKRCIQILVSFTASFHNGRDILQHLLHGNPQSIPLRSRNAIAKTETQRLNSNSEPYISLHRSSHISLRPS